MIGICFNDLIILFCKEAIIPAPGNTKFPKPKPFNPIAPNPLLINLKNLATLFYVSYTHLRAHET